MKILKRVGTRKNWKVFDFGGQHGGKLVSKSDQKSMLTSKGDFVKKLYFSLGEQFILEIQHVQVGSKKEQQID